MATASTLLSMESYLTASYKPDVDFVDGEIEERNVGEHTHATIQKMLLVLFGQNETQWGVEAVPEQRIRVSPNRVRVCDIAVLDARAPWEEVILTPPLMCIEVLSPKDRLNRAELVLADYFAMGVRSIWLIDPYKRLFYTHNTQGFRLDEGGIICLPERELRVDLKTIFQKLDEKMGSR